VGIASTRAIGEVQAAALEAARGGGSVAIEGRVLVFLLVVLMT
jgi:hypothetical protein